MNTKPTFKFPYKGIVTEGYITATNGDKLLIDGAYDANGLFFIKKSDDISGKGIKLYASRKLALDAMCQCDGGMDGWQAQDEYEHNHPITGGPPDYHAGVSQSTKAPKEYPGATESDLANPTAGIDDLPENVMRRQEPGSTLEQDGGLGSGQKGHHTAQQRASKGHVSMHAYHPQMTGPQHRASAGTPQEAAGHLSNLWKQYPEHHVTFQTMAGPNEGMTHTVKPHPGAAQQAHKLVPHHIF